MRSSTSVKRFRGKVQRLLSRHPALFYPLYRRLGRQPELMVDDATEVVIEGFPRSANTFAVVAFQAAQTRPVQIAHHLHAPAQVIAGCRLGIPVMALIRRPEDAVPSLVIREPWIRLQDALADYLRFYETVLKYREGCLVARFEDVIGDYGSVIRRLNARYGTAFGVFEHTPEARDAVFEAIREINRSRSPDGTVDERRIARPSEERRALAEELRRRLESAPRLKEQLNDCKALYATLCGSSNQEGKDA